MRQWKAQKAHIDIGRSQNGKCLAHKLFLIWPYFYFYYIFIYIKQAAGCWLHFHLLEIRALLLFLLHSLPNFIYCVELCSSITQLGDNNSLKQRETTRHNLPTCQPANPPAALDNTKHLVVTVFSFCQRVFCIPKPFWVFHLTFARSWKLFPLTARLCLLGSALIVSPTSSKLPSAPIFFSVLLFNTKLVCFILLLSFSLITSVLICYHVCNSPGRILNM